MNRNQRICIKAGFLLLILATLFPPWTYKIHRPAFPGLRGATYESYSSYGFLLAPPYGGATIDLPLLFVEWLLIGLVTGGLFMIFRSAKGAERENKTDTALVKPKKRRLLVAITVILAVLVLCLGVVSYAALKEVWRLDTGIRNVKAIVDSQLSPPRYLAYLVPPPPDFARFLPDEGPSQGQDNSLSVVITGIWGGTVNVVQWKVGGKQPLSADQQQVLAEYARAVNAMQPMLQRETEVLRTVREELNELY